MNKFLRNPYHLFINLSDKLIYRITVNKSYLENEQERNIKEINMSDFHSIQNELVLEYKAYNASNFKQILQISYLSPEAIQDIEMVAQVLPFKVNSYVIEELIDWENYAEDPIFRLTFPQKGMLKPHHYQEMKSVFLSDSTDKKPIQETANRIRLQLNPHPAGQMEHNVPELNGIKLSGMQHKYDQTVLFFPSQGQTCHAYCTFCFRWPQFVGMDEFKFAMNETDLLIEYLKQHPEVTDVLFTGGDPMIMRTAILEKYFTRLIDADLPNLKTIRIGTKSLSYWPYRFVSDSDSKELLSLFQKVVSKGIHLAIMAHFNHPNELKTEVLKQAVENIRATGTQIRTQSPVLKHINDSGDVWAEMWRKQVDLGMIPYYMFVVRDTGAQHYFGVPLVESWEIFRSAYGQVSGICRTVRGPSMSSTPGKIQILGVSEIADKKVIVLRMLQGRNSNWVATPFFAEYDPNAIWLDDLKPAFGEKQFFFEKDNDHLKFNSDYHE